MPRKAPNDHYASSYDRYHANQRRQSGQRLVECRVCSEPMLLIGTNHLKRHGMTQQQYKVLFPGAPTCSPDVTERRAKTKVANLYEPIALTPQVRSVLVGSLLGDGFLECTKRNARYKEHSPNEDYMAWKAKNLGTTFTMHRRCDTLTDRRSGRVYVTHRITTRCHPLLTEWHSRWYHEGRKVVSRSDVEDSLDSLALAVWFYDDGHVHRRKGDYRASLYTMAFTLEETEWLANLLRNRFGLDCHAILLKVNSHEKPSICFPREARNRLVEVISQHPAPGMEYKLNTCHPQAPRGKYLRQRKPSPR